MELCFEADRYFTTRRRLLSGKRDTKHTPDRRMYGDNGNMYGMNVFAGDSFESTEFYQRTVLNAVYLKIRCISIPFRRMK